MEAFRTSNPALSANSFGGFVGVRSDAGTMTIQGTVNKTAILLAIATVTAIWPWKLAFGADPAAVMPYLLVGALGGLGVALVTIFVKKWAPVLAPIYAALEGLALGSVSALYERRFPGIVFQAMALTFGVLATLLIAYKTRAIKATENFKLGVVAATGAICLVYITSAVMGLFGVHVGFIHSNGWLGIGISVVIVFVAALNLVLDFDFIEK